MHRKAVGPPTRWAWPPSRARQEAGADPAARCRAPGGPLSVSPGLGGRLGGMNDIYRDRWITCTQDGLRIRGYYFPWGDKTIPYADIRSVRRVEMGPLSGQGRIWGTANPTLWASLDPAGGGKAEALVLDVGRRVRPFITPDDVGAVEAAIRDHGAPGPARRARCDRGTVRPAATVGGRR